MNYANSVGLSMDVYYSWCNDNVSFRWPCHAKAHIFKCSNAPMYHCRKILGPGTYLDMHTLSWKPQPSQQAWCQKIVVLQGTIVKELSSKGKFWFMACGKSLALQCVSSLWHDFLWNPMWGHKLFECTLGVITWQSRNVWKTKKCCRTTVFQTASIATRWAPDLFHEVQLPSFLEDKMGFLRHIWCRCYIFIWCCRRGALGLICTKPFWHLDQTDQ